MLYFTYCQFCHGDSAISGGLVPDLRYSAYLNEEDWRDVVINGSLMDAGMISFKDMMSADEADAIRAYVVDRLIKDKATALAEED